MKRLSPNNCLLTLCLAAGAVLLNGCQGCLVTPSSNPTASPSLQVTLFDYTNRTYHDITGARTAPTAGNPYQYAGLLDLSSETSGFDSNIGVHATDPTGLNSLEIIYSFYTCAENGSPQLLGLTSFNNGIPGPSAVTLNATPPQFNGGKVTTDLSYPITITSTDLKSFGCFGGKPGTGNGTIQLRVTATNFSSNANTRTTLAEFDVKVGVPSPLPQQ